MLAVDMDGTALRSDKTFSRRNREALQKVIDSGVIVVPDTGRSEADLGPLTDLRGVRYAITANGACIEDLKSKKLLDEDVMDLSKALAALTLLEPFDVRVYAHVRGGVLLSPDPGGRFAKLFPWARFAGDSTPPLAERLIRQNGPVRKIGVLTYDVETHGKILSMRERFGDVAVYTTGPHSIELNSATASKGGALRKLCTLLKIPREAVAAIGDNQNDSSMLRFAGYAVAMGNAIPEVLGLADEVTLSNDEDGVAAFLEKHWA